MNDTPLYKQSGWYRDRNAAIVESFIAGVTKEQLSERTGLSVDAINDILLVNKANDLKAEREWYAREVKDLPLAAMPPKRELSDGEFMEKVGRLINAMINEAGSCVKHGTHQERIEARYFLLDGGVDDWVHFAGIEVSLPLRRMINEAANGYYKEEAI